MATIDLCHRIARVDRYNTMCAACTTHTRVSAAARATPVSAVLCKARIAARGAVNAELTALEGSKAHRVLKSLVVLVAMRAAPEVLRDSDARVGKIGINEALHQLAAERAQAGVALQLVVRCCSCLRLSCTGV